MKDRLALIAVAIVVSILAWMFWHYLGENAFNILMTISLIGLIGDNYRLRKKLTKRI